MSFRPASVKGASRPPLWGVFRLFLRSLARLGQRDSASACGMTIGTMLFRSASGGEKSLWLERIRTKEISGYVSVDKVA
ncbi:hypothetical protein COY07_05620 [Candidatus Peregrinibacteria bacterium CG_4_10_14_0_2_um_filter_43_11]|nr:MAG: hypothetical protein COY07_05620 [Candidatus Peregrinibacteria bacterium CG_4_10_14_0_2_um_filter_43_11]